MSNPILKSLTPLSRRERFNAIYKIIYPELNPIPWQLTDLDTAITLAEIVWLRSRGGSKTQDGSVLATYQCLTVGNGGWYSADTGQMERIIEEIKHNPFFDDVTEKKAICVNGARVLFGTLGGKRNLRGPRNHWLIIDEEGQIRDAKTHAGYEGVMGTLSASKWHHILHMGTGIRGSQLDENVNISLIPTLSHKWIDCPWLVNAGQIQKEFDEGIRPDWLLGNEYNCEFNAAGGSVFTNILETTVMPLCDQMKQGIDFNAQPGNVGIRIGIKNDIIYILAENVFIYRRDDSDLQNFCSKYPTEVESGGWNDIYAPALKGVSKAPFTETGEGDDTKSARVRSLLHYQIAIDPQRTPHLYKDLLKATWSQTLKGKETVDTNDLHYLAALMHAIYAGSGGGEFVPKRDLTIDQVFGIQLGNVEFGQ